MVLVGGTEGEGGGEGDVGGGEGGEWDEVVGGGVARVHVAGGGVVEGGREEVGWARGEGEYRRPRRRG